MELLELLLLSSLLLAVKAGVPCGEDSSMCCSDGESCCRLKNGTLGCFPSENAVCCEGSSFACKQDYTCHMQYRMCIDLDMVIPPISPTHLPKVCEIESPVHELGEPCGPAMCPGDAKRCCPQAMPVPACCPFPLGECCSDGLHCCPMGYRCDVPHQGCILSTSFKKVIHKFSRPVPKAPAGTVFCPDHSVCYDNQTCCHLKSGQFGCCPDGNGVCCPDGQHCCPHDTVCDIFQEKCVKKVAWASYVEPTPVAQREVPVKRAEPKPKANTIVCPDPSYKCPDNTTCCHLSSGIYGCCPYPNAVCCPDGDHCCPHGYQCDTVHQRCISSRNIVQQPLLQKRSNALPTLEKYQSNKISMKNMLSAKFKPVLRSNDILCPDKLSVCEEGTTCCLMTDGTYGCCPYINATCCADRQHCCPMSYTCDLVHQQCAQAQFKTQHPVHIPMSFVIVQTFIDDEPIPSEDEKELVDEDGQFPMPHAIQDALTLFNRLLNFAPPITEIPEPESEEEKTSSCSTLSCPRGTSCCQPRGENQKPVCCPGSGPVTCCPGGFCCPGGHECNPLTLKCYRSHSPSLRASLGVEPIAV